MNDLTSQADLISKSGLFDPDWYLDQYPDVKMLGMDPIRHFLQVGALLERDPSQQFDTKFYLVNNPDVAAAQVNPLLHYITYGADEARAPKLPIEPLKGHPVAASTAKACNLIVFISGEPTDKPGYTYRITRYASAFQKLGHDISCIPYQHIPKHIESITAAKMLIIWRAAWRAEIKAAIDAAKNNNVPVVFDLDDLMVRPEFATSEIIDAIRYDNKDPERVARLYADVRRAMAAANFCTATTHELAWHMRRDGRRQPTFVLPNGYGFDTYSLSRIHARIKAAHKDGLIRIGYASGSRTHQADFRVCADAVAELLRANPNCRLVLFAKRGLVTLDQREFPALVGLEGQIEWRAFVPHAQLHPK